MIAFIVLIVIGLAGTAGTVWFARGGLRFAEYPVPARGQEWFALSPELVESAFTMRARQAARNLLKRLLIWLIRIYREISRRITVKQAVKRKVREFLYDHTPEGVRHPSEFWSRAKDHDEDGTH